jgi:hypothetical protein
MPVSIGQFGSAGNLKNPAEPLALGYRVNYIKNPSFEVDTTDWVAGGGATIARVTGDFYTGSAALEVTNAAGSFVNIQDRIPLLSEGPFQVSAYVKLLPGTSTANYYLRYLQYETVDSTSTVDFANLGTTSLSVTGNWVRLSGSFTKAPIGNYAVIRVVTASAVSGDKFLVDSVMFEDTATLGTYFDGSNGGFWTGTPNNSYSGASPY